MRWSAEELDRLKELHAEKLSGGLIADILSREFHRLITRNAVVGQHFRKGMVVGHGKNPSSPNVPRKPYEPQSQKSWEPRPSVRNGAIVRQSRIPFIDTTPVSDADIPQRQRRDILSLTHETCRYPVGEPGHPDFFFCGAFPMAGKPYCGPHCAVAYMRVPPARRVPFIIRRAA